MSSPGICCCGVVIFKSKQVRTSQDSVIEMPFNPAMAKAIPTLMALPLCSLHWQSQVGQHKVQSFIQFCIVTNHSGDGCFSACAATRHSIIYLSSRLIRQLKVHLWLSPNLWGQGTVLPSQARPFCGWEATVHSIWNPEGSGSTWEIHARKSFSLIVNGTSNPVLFALCACWLGKLSV